MTTFLLIWYACGWAILGAEGRSCDEITVGDIILCLLFGPALALCLSIYFLSRKYEGRVIWRKP